MIQRENGIKSAMLLERIVVCPSQAPVTEEVILAVVTAINEHAEEIGDSLPVQLKECENGCEVVLYAKSGAAIYDQPTDSPLAIYLARGLFKKTVENMNRLRSNGTIDFEGKMQIAVESERAVGQREENAVVPSPTEHNSLSDPVLVDRIDGEPSDLNKRIESVWAFCFVGSHQSIDCISQLEFEDLTRVGVLARNEM